MPNNSLYDGILMPQGGVYEPGPPVMLPPSAPAKQSAVVRALIASDPIGMGPGGGTGWNGYSSTIDDNSLRSFDQIRADARPPTTVDAANPLDVTRLGLTNDPFRTPAETAIETYAPRSSAFSPWGPDWTTGIGAVHGGGNSLVQEAGQSPIQGVGQRGEMRKGPDGRQYQYMQLDGANGGNGHWGWLPASGSSLVGSPGKFAGGDPWAADRFGGESVVSRPGMVTGAAPGLSPVARAIVQSAPPGNFLQDRGVDTQGMNVSQIANELNKQMSSSSRNADGTRGFGV